MKFLVFDPAGGASGDMILAALISLGCPESCILDCLEKLGLGKPVINIQQKKTNFISCLNLSFDINDCEHERSFKDIRHTIEISDIESGIKNTAINIFSRLAEAEAHVHGVSCDNVHFHEVGALDSIFDIVGIAAAIHYFKPENIYTAPLPLSTGTIKTRHGIMPVPAPATLKLIEGLPAKATNVTGELVTPTGAAVIKTLAEINLPNELTILSSGYGCGSKTFEGWPNMFRVMLCESHKDMKSLYVIETTIDDMIPEDFDAALDMIKKAGAIDTCIIPCIMKNGRPGTIMQALTEHGMLENVSSAILENTTTIGVRFYPVGRRVLDRKEYRIDSEVGEVGIKEVTTPSGAIRRKPEYRDIIKISDETGLPVTEIRQIIAGALHRNGAK